MMITALRTATTTCLAIGCAFRKRPVETEAEEAHQLGRSFSTPRRWPPCAPPSAASSNWSIRPSSWSASTRMASRRSRRSRRRRRAATPPPARCPHRRRRPSCRSLRRGPLARSPRMRLRSRRRRTRQRRRLRLPRRAHRLQRLLHRLVLLLQAHWPWKAQFPVELHLLQRRHLLLWRPQPPPPPTGACRRCRRRTLAPRCAPPPALTTARRAAPTRVM